MTIHDQLARLTAIMSLAPSDDLMDEVERICSSESACKVFWTERIENPAWFPFMVRRDWFKKPPNILREGDMIVHPGWPEAAILLKFAKLIPAEVARVLAAMPDFDNPRVGDQIIRIAAELRSPEDIRLVQQRVAAVLTDGTRSARLWLLEMLREWLNAGASQEVIALLPAVLNSTGSEKRPAAQATDSWEIGRLDEQLLVALTVTHGHELAALLCNALATYEDSERHDEFSSTLWLEDFSGNRGFGHQTETILILRLYAVCRDLITREQNEGAVFVDNLLRRQVSALIGRLRWQLYSDFSEYYLRQAHDDVLQRVPEMSHLPHSFELQNMIGAFVTRYGNHFLSSAELSLVVDSIRRGPLDDSGVMIDDAKYAERFRAKQIQPFRPLLKDNQLFTLHDTKGNPLAFSPEDYKPLRGGGEAHVIEQRSPITPQELARMEDAKLWTLLNEWVPDPNRTNPEWWIEEDVSGLAKAFAEAVHLEPRRFNPDSTWWTRLKRPVFFWRILDDALATEKAPDPNEHAWKTWIGLSEFVVAQTPIENPNESGVADDRSVTNPTWKYARSSVARLLERVLKHEHSPPITYAHRIKAVLERLLRDDDPRLEQIEKSWSSSSFDWLSKGINSASGTAIEGLFSFALWYKKYSSESDAITWIPALLAEQLNKEGQSPAVFAVLGSQLALLVHLFPEWSKENDTTVFPFERSQEQARACLVAHITYNNPHGIVIGAFPQLPNQALALLHTETEEHKTTFQAEIPFRVGYHLSYYYWNGLPDQAVATQRLQRFFETATAETRGRLIAQIGHVFHGASSGSASKELLERARLLWDRRFAIISSAVRKDPTVKEMFEPELESFSVWIKNDCFEPAWRLSRFAEALKFLDKAPATVDLAEALEKMSIDPENLLGVMRCVQLLSEKLTESFRWSMREGDLKNTIKRGLETSDVATRTIAEIARDNLLRQGLFAYQEL